MDGVDVLERLQAIADTCKYLHEKGDEACFNELSGILEREMQEAVDAGLIDDPFVLEEEEGSFEEELGSPEGEASDAEDGNEDGDGGLEEGGEGLLSEEDKEDEAAVLSDGEKKSSGCVSDETRKNILDVLQDTRF